ncbi:hypothetical protein WME73_14495 [Sorangium sp. So ce302]|uniref:hypothetical protein n=1 Tax=Sorangium sp. So ce302 TaxID=3133297 RepID=UPI003F5E4672
MQPFEARTTEADAAEAFAAVTKLDARQASLGSASGAVNLALPAPAGRRDSA